MHRKSYKKTYKHKPSEEYCNHNAYGPRGTFLLTFKTTESKKLVIEKGASTVIRNLNKAYSRSYVVDTTFSDFEPPKSPFVKACVSLTGDYRALAEMDEYLRHTFEISSEILYPQVRRNSSHYWDHQEAYQKR